MRRIKFFLKKFASIKTLEAGAHISTVIALLLLFAQLHINAQDKSAEISLSYLQSYNSDPISSHRQRLEKMWLSRKNDLLMINSYGGVRRDNADLLVKFVVEEYDKNHEEAPSTLSIQELSAFYDQVSICVQTKLCDKKIIYAYFYENMQDFWSTYQKQIISLRKSTAPELGIALEKQVNSQK